MERYKIDFESMEWESPAVGVSFKAYEQDGRRLRLVEFTKDFVEPDWCTKGHTGLILEGQMKIDFNGNVIEFGPGDGVFIPAGEEHKHKGRVLTDKVKIILVE
ncbi:MAG: cupin domain-containing protein [Planctomycetota bacterium]|jgi:quercetin dioxygenase-like cupin family protein